MADEHQELVIIKRHGDHEEGHHGGAWKIAFADFMTAMMALFLVLWLISATNPKQRVVIARYFNPIKLAQVASDKKGLDDATAGGVSSHAAPKEGEPSEKRLELPPAQGKRALFDNGSGQATHEEAALFRDPYAVLAEIESQQQDQAKAALDQKAAAAPVSDDAFHDPFATVPQPEASHPDPNANAPTAPGQGAGAGSAASAAAATDQNPPAADLQASKLSEAPQATAPVPPAPAPAPAKEIAIPTPTPMKEKLSAKEAAKEAAKNAAQAKAAAEQAEHINEVEAGKLQNELANAVHKDAAAPNVEVKSTSEGVLISLTDEANYAMFAVGSAEPQAKTIEVMAKVAQLLKSHPGLIVVRGHTDGRPYKSSTYDNWQLSAARAQMAHYMLVRGGLDEKRIERIEGYADHRLKTPNDPLAAENRRIEILVRKDKS